MILVMIVEIIISMIRDYLREFACANERHPWDVRVKVGSERKFASSDNRVISRSVVLFADSARGDPPDPLFSSGILGEKEPSR